MPAKVFVRDLSSQACDEVAVFHSANVTGKIVELASSAATRDAYLRLSYNFPKYPRLSSARR